MCERNIDWLPLARPQLGGLARNLGTFPDWESNLRPFSSQTSIQPTEPHQPGPSISISFGVKPFVIGTSHPLSFTFQHRGGALSTAHSLTLHLQEDVEATVG